MTQSKDDRSKRILEIIHGTPMTTDDIQRSLGEESFACPEDLIRILNKMKRQGTIKGRPNPIDGGWSWWVETDSSRKD